MGREIAPSIMASVWKPDASDNEFARLRSHPSAGAGGRRTAMKIGPLVSFPLIVGGFRVMLLGGQAVLFYGLCGWSVLALGTEVGTTGGGFRGTCALSLIGG